MINPSKFLSSQIFYPITGLVIIYGTTDDNDDDDDDDDDDDEFFLWYGWPTKGVALFPAGPTVRDPHHRESPTRRKKDLNLRKTWVQALMNEVVQ